MAKDREKIMKQRLNQIKRKTRKRKRLTKDEADEQDRLIEILNEETNLIKTENRGSLFRLLSIIESNKQQKYLQQVKQINKDRAKKGLKPVFYKKRELKEMKFKEEFDNLEKKGRVDKAIDNAFKRI